MIPEEEETVNETQKQITLGDIYGSVDCNTIRRDNRLAIDSGNDFLLFSL